MYTCVQKVRSKAGVLGVNTFVHRHGEDFVWPEGDALWRLPYAAETVGPLVYEASEVPPGGNDIFCYLDVMAPEDTPKADVTAALELFLDNYPHLIKFPCTRFMYRTVAIQCGYWDEVVDKPQTEMEELVRMAWGALQ